MGTSGKTFYSSNRNVYVRIFNGVKKRNETEAERVTLRWNFDFHGNKAPKNISRTPALPFLSI